MHDPGGIGRKMITLKASHEIELMRRAGKITAAARALAGEMVAPGVTTREIDKAVYKYIKSQGAEPSFLNYQGYPASVCVSVNDEIIHGIPGPRVLKEGDIVSIDVGAFKDGFTGDSAYTFACGKISDDAKRLLEATKGALEAGIAMAHAGNRIGDISAAVEEYATSRGFGVVRDYTGHGVGRHLHEDPEVPNFGRAGHGPRLMPGMCIAIEPMITQGSWQVRVLSNDWTVVTEDNSLSAHFEHSIGITKAEPIILTRLV